VNVPSRSEVQLVVPWTTATPKPYLEVGFGVTSGNCADSRRSWKSRQLGTQTPLMLSGNTRQQRCCRAPFLWISRLKTTSGQTGQSQVERENQTSSRAQHHQPLHHHERRSRVAGSQVGGVGSSRVHQRHGCQTQERSSHGEAACAGLRSDSKEGQIIASRASVSFLFRCSQSTSPSDEDRPAERLRFSLTYRTAHGGELVLQSGVISM
jgi:hypothetical protein